MGYKLTEQVTYLKGVGPKVEKACRNVGIKSVTDLINYWPRRYEDYSEVKSIAYIQPGLVSIRGRFRNIQSRFSRNGLHITQAQLYDDTSAVSVVWFNQSYRAASLNLADEYFVSGEYMYRGRSVSITNPRVEKQTASTSKLTILPIYRESKLLSNSTIRNIFKKNPDIFDLISETLPQWIIDEHNLLSRGEALRILHLPQGKDSLDRAKHRLGLEELFHMQLAGQLSRAELNQESAAKIRFHKNLAVKYVSNLPFELTQDQRRTAWRILQDMENDMPMNRLLEGDVGSGKTVVACMSAIMAMNAGFQVLVMAPTEILARQHYDTFRNLLSFSKWADNIDLLVGSLSAKHKSAVHKRLADGSTMLAVGTHALIQDKVAVQNVGLVVIDEQHRFGVNQRSKLKSKSGLSPHVLCMTATPIPRTLALTLYGELSISQLKDKPADRQRIITEVISPKRRDWLNTKIKQSVDDGRQVFIVCPLIEEDDNSALVSAEGMHRKLTKELPKKYRIGLLHGSMKPDVKDALMTKFKDGKVDILVTTTVIEVGVDVPNASVMVVESAERFGLAQIHQLRGRVGRSAYQGYCYLIPSDEQYVSKRLRMLTTIDDGFRLSEVDLEMRGPGAIYGTRQSGALDLRIAQLHDENLILQAKKLAVEFMHRGEDVLKYPYIHERVSHFRSIQNLN